MDSSQDYRLLLGYENKTHTVLRFSRQYDTCDPRDLKITVGGCDLCSSKRETQSNFLRNTQKRARFTGRTYLILFLPNKCISISWR
ncbi:hypothetical protein P5V15_009600 [Pogonomyrmex californicus]